MDNPNFLKNRILGRTGLNVSSIGFGTCAIGGNSHTWAYGPTDDKLSIAAMEKALEMGCNFFDTADIYGKGHAEKLLGKVIKNSNRSQVVIATKAGYEFNADEGRQNFGFQWLLKALDASLTRLETDYIDVFQLHNPPPEIVVHPIMADTIGKLKQSGKARFFGVSVQHYRDIPMCLNAKWIDTIQVRYNMLSHEASEILRMAQQDGLGVIAREPLANGFLTGKYNEKSIFPKGDFRSLWSETEKQKMLEKVQNIKNSLPIDQSLSQHAVEWVLKNNSVSTVIVGCKTPEQVRDNFGIKISS